MIEMVRHSLKKHKYKIALGVPMVFLLASSLSLVRDSEEMCIIPDDNRFVEVGETVTLHVIANADTPINVIGGTIHIPTDFVTLDTISREDSIIDLWTEEPVLGDDQILRFAGGVVNKTGFLGEGKVITLVLHPTQEGEATIAFADTHMLAHDGTGMEVTCANNPIILSIRPATYPSPDVNGDKQVNIFDFGIVSARLFMTYERPYDLNLDGLITMSDLGILISNLSGSSRLGSLAISWIK
jgi:hypothetical protein